MRRLQQLKERKVKGDAASQRKKCRSKEGVLAEDCDEGRDKVIEVPELERLFRLEEDTLQQYIDDMRLDNVFSEMVEELLVAAPQNPVQYMIEFLITKYPRQAMNSSYAKTFPAAANSTGGGVPLTGLIDVKLNPDEDEIMESDGKFVDIDQNDEIAPLKRDLLLRRRGAIHGIPSMAFSIPCNRTDSGKPIPQKTILNWMEKDVFFQNLEDFEKEALAECFVERQFEQGHVIFTERKESDENFVFLVLEGSCRHDLNGRKVSVSKTGVFFGQHVLLLGTAFSSTTVTVHSKKAKLAALSSEDFVKVVHGERKTRREEIVSLLSGVRVFQTLRAEELQQLAEDVCKIETFTQKDVVIKQQDPSTKMYVIMNGEAKCEQQFSFDGKSQFVTSFTRGDWFGEIALIAARPRAATVIASTELRCVSIEYERFKRVFGSLLDLLRRDDKLFKSFVCDKI